MSFPIPEISFAQIRPGGQTGTRADAFEELASVLIKQSEEWPPGTRFSRFGNPDGGREGRGELPNGDVWAWQAKYIFTIDSSSINQVKASFLRALQTEPRLTRYFVVFPIDRSAGDGERAKSAFTRWEEATEEWKLLATEEGLSVEFTFLGAHELTTMLTQPQNEGRIKYWFDINVLSVTHQQQRIDEVTAKLGPRYSPEVHVEVPAAQAFEGIGLTSEYVQRWKHILGDLRATRPNAWRPPENKEEIFEDPLRACAMRIEEADEALQRVIDSGEGFDELTDPEQEVEAALTAVTAIEKLLQIHSLSDEGYYTGNAAMLYSRIRDCRNALYAANTLNKSSATHAAREGELLLTGRAGIGKTHLLCDVARRRIASGYPTIMLLGQEFDPSSLFKQIPELWEMRETVDGLLAVLDAAAEATESKALLIIDAVNESERPERWVEITRALRTKVARFSNVGLVISCRTEFLDSVIGHIDMPEVQHFGFEEATDVAIKRFAEEYRLDIPTFPILNPEFRNPLYLRLACESLKTLGASRFVLGSTGLITICDAFLDATNKRLSEADRCDYDMNKNLVRSVVHKLAQLEGSYFDRSDVDNITSEALPDRSWSKSLMKGLLDEGILIEVRPDRIGFGYQRIGDVARAGVIASSQLSDIKTWLSEHLSDHFNDLGTLAALAIMLPEQHNVELIDLVIEDQMVPVDIIDVFVESLTLRDSDSISERTIDIVQYLLNKEEFAPEVRTQLLRLACVPEHPLNARWLHRCLANQDLSDRDATWSLWLIGALDFEEHSPVRTIIDWAWPTQPNKPSIPEREIVTLATITLGWFLTTSDRRVRDRATKAMVAIGEIDATAFTEALNLLVRVNDTYVVERVTAAACGVALRNPNTSDLRSIANVLAGFFSEESTHHLLIRDYVKRVFNAARLTEWKAPQVSFPNDNTWPIEAESRDVIEELAGPPDYLYSSIWYSVSEMGDFGRYVVVPALRNFSVTDHEELLEVVERVIFDRVRALGWTPEKFGDIDRRLPHGRLGGPVERVGKKYQWIAFYEILGILTDHFAIKSDWSPQDLGPYRYAEQIIWRDIDVTQLVRESSSTTSGDWFSPVKAEFPSTIVNDYPVDMQGVPDPMDILSVTDSEGDQWLTLLGYPPWRQQHSPDLASLHPPTREIWMHFHAYLVPSEDVDALKTWALSKDWFGRWMPDIAEPANLLLGGHPNDPQWTDTHEPFVSWDSSQGGLSPTQFTQCGAWYAGTGTDRDASTEQEINGFVPSKALFDLLGLQPGVDFTWKKGEELAVLDPAVGLESANVLLLRRSLFSQLNDAGFSLFWTVLVGHEHLTGGLPFPDDNHRWISASASYVMVEDEIKKIDSFARQYSPGPKKELGIPWLPRSSEL